MSASWRELGANGEDGRRAFRSLLSDDSPHVRCWVAAQLLARGDTTVLATLEEIANTGDEVGFDAGILLTEWQAGRLAPPLGDL